MVSEYKIYNILTCGLASVAKRSGALISNTPAADIVASLIADRKMRHD